MIEALYTPFQKWSEVGTVWIYSDPHFGDMELDAGVRNRPSAEEQVKMINSKVGRKDTLIILGDVGDVEYVRQLRGYKILIMGNHDAGITNYQRQIKHIYYNFREYPFGAPVEKVKKLYPGWKMSITQEWEKVTDVENWHFTLDNQLFDEVYAGPLMIAERLLLSHEPIMNINWAFNIHGHIHDSKHKNDKYHFNVCSDVIDYMPINMNQWMKQGYLSHIESIHRTTIDKATERKKKRGGRSFNNHGQKR